MFFDEDREGSQSPQGPMTQEIKSPPDNARSLKAVIV
jgi:hypothetical protein